MITQLLPNSIVGYTFFKITGFHGAHLVIGSYLLIITIIRIVNNFFFKESFCIEVAARYRHFVDAV